MPSTAIPAARDRLQSRLLVWAVAPILGYFVMFTCRELAQGCPAARTDLIESVAVSLLFSLAAWGLRAATPFAAVCGGIICMLITESWQRQFVTSLLRGALRTPIFHSALSPLVLLFLLTFIATHLGQNHKREIGLGEKRRGRNAAQVIANLGIAALLGSYWSVYLFAWIGNLTTIAAEVHSVAKLSVIFTLPMLAALAEATSDTVSSEIGQAFGGTPFMLTTFRTVPPGTDGAISLYGTLAGIAAAAIIAAAGVPALGMSPTACAVAFAAGVAGLFFDSLLGATIERHGWINNDLVNFTSTGFAAAVALLAIRFCPDSFW